METTPKIQASTCPKRGSPKYPEILSAILKDLQAGLYAPGTRLPTDVEFAQVLKVDRLTVSRALRELAKEGHLIRRRGSGTYATDLSTQPPIPGRNIRVGVLCPSKVLPADVDGTFWGKLLRGLLKHWNLECGATRFELGAEAAATRGEWSIPNLGIGVVAMGPSAQSLEKHPPLELLRRERLDSLVVLSPLEEDWLEELLRGPAPAVLVDYPGRRYAGRADVVFLDPVSGYAEAVEWLARQGRQRIHFIGALIGATPPPELATPAERSAYLRAHKLSEPDSMLRQHAYRMGMDACGLPVGADRIHALSFNPLAIAEWGRQIAQRGEAAKPDAIVCAAQRHTELLAALFRDMRQEILVVGPRYGPPSMEEAYIQVDCDLAAEAAATLVIARLQKPQRVHLRVGVNMHFRPPLKAEH